MSHAFTIENRRGAAAVEFALAFIFFLTVTIGLVELGRGAWAYSTVAHACRQGARFAMARGSLKPVTADSVESVVKSHSLGLDPAKIVVTTTFGAVERGNAVRVRVQYPFEFLASSLILQDGAKVTLSNTSEVIFLN